MMQPAPRIELLLVDDHGLFREGLASILDKEPDSTVIGKYAVAAEALQDLEKSLPAVILLDFDLGIERALDFIPAARGKGFKGQILIVTAGVGDQEAVQLIQAGVTGYTSTTHPKCCPRQSALRLEERHSSRKCI